MQTERIGEVAENSIEELDLLPEQCYYRDEGCELASSCLNCPFAQCVYDEPRGKQRWLKRLRTREMSRLFDRGKKVWELAQIFSVSERTVQRTLKELHQITRNNDQRVTNE